MALVQRPNLDRQPLPTSPRFTGQESGRLLDSLTSHLNHVFEFPIHGSCSRCHHLHTNRAIQLPLDPQQHTRFNCDNCEQPIIGIGRTSTQTTLASIETNAAGRRSWPSEQEAAASGQEYQPDLVLAQWAPLRVDTSGQSGQLSTITEGVSPAQPSSAVLTPAVSGELRSMRSISHESVPTHQDHKDEEHGISKRGPVNPHPSVRTDRTSKSPGGFWWRQSQRRIRERVRKHLRKPRSFNISRLGLHVDVSPTPSSPGRSLPPLTHAQPIGTIELGDNGKRPTSQAIIGPRSDISSALPTPVQSSQVSNHSTEPPQQPASAHPDALIGPTMTLAEKRERIRALRREATLKRQAELISSCECQSDCQCRNESIPSNAVSFGADRSERSIQVPIHPFQHLLGERSESSTSGGSSSGINGGSFLVGIGSQYPTIEGLTDHMMERQAVPSDRISQASTVYVRSNESSVSLASRRPRSLRRSSAPPASVPRRSGEGVRPELLEVVRNRHFAATSPDAGPDALSSARRSDSDASPQAADEMHGPSG